MPNYPIITFRSKGKIHILINGTNLQLTVGFWLLIIQINLQIKDLLNFIDMTDLSSALRCGLSLILEWIAVLKVYIVITSQG